MTTAPRLMTADELLTMPNNGFRYELVEGELRTMPPAGHDHGRIAMNIGASLASHVKARGLGAVYAAETGFKLSSDPDTVRAPDLAFVRKERAQALTSSRGFFPGAPDLVVEVVSPGDLYTEVEVENPAADGSLEVADFPPRVEEKVVAWLEAGTQVVLILNPRQRTVTLYRSRADVKVLTEDEVLRVEEVVPGWSVAVLELFA